MEVLYTNMGTGRHLRLSTSGLTVMYPSPVRSLLGKDRYIFSTNNDVANSLEADRNRYTNMLQKLIIFHYQMYCFENKGLYHGLQ